MFVGHFTLDAALEVVTSATLDQATVLGAMDSLVAKSMVATRPVGAMMRYRLLDTTRAYVLEIAIDDAETAELAVCHAAYYRRWLEQTGSEWSNLRRARNGPPISPPSTMCGRLWSGASAMVETPTSASASPPPLRRSSWRCPCCRNASAGPKARLWPSATPAGGLDEMHLQAALGVSLMFTRGGRDRARVALERSLAIAEARGDTLDQVHLFGPLNLFHLRAGNFATALEFARRCSAAAASLDDPVAIALAHSILGISLHLRGDLAQARTELEAALDRGPRTQRTTTIYLGFEGKILAKAILARTLWLRAGPLKPWKWLGRLSKRLPPSIIP